MRPQSRTADSDVSDTQGTTHDEASRPAVDGEVETEGSPLKPVAPAAHLPSIDGRLQEVYSIEFDRDGYPLRHGVANPIIGAYVVNDYLRRFSMEGNSGLLAGAVHVATAAFDRMSAREDAAVFLYSVDGAPKPARNPEPHYSGLTQSYYLDIFGRLAALTREERWKEAARQVLHSMQVRAEEGGVLYERPAGPIIAETPAEPNDVVLNGWLTAIVHLYRYAETAQDKACAKFAAETTDALEHYLPLFDVERLANSRYATAGFGLFRIVLPSATDRYQIRNLALEVPGEAAYPVGRELAEAEQGRWRQYALDADWDGLTLGRRSLRLNLVLNYLSHPRRNVLRFDVHSGTSGRVALQFRRTRYSPTTTSPVYDSEWFDLVVQSVEPGWDSIRFAIPWSKTQLLAYPTNFLKREGGRLYNGYHWLHVKQLKALYDITRRDVFNEFAQQWESYIRRWTEMPIYADVEKTARP